MTLRDWIEESKHRFATDPLPNAVAESTKALGRGGLRRIGRHIGQPIWSRDDWDVLVVLDACRVDLWNEVAPEYGLPESDGVWSNASCSIDWIERNLNQHPDEAANTGYITGNPFADHTAADARSAGLDGDMLAYFAPLYKSEWGPVDGGAVETIPPAPLTDHAIDAWRRRDELNMDRLIVHYMQPHQPYRSRPDWVHIGKNLKNLVQNRSMAGACAWQRCRRGLIDESELWAAYRDNLCWVLDDVTDRLLTNCDADIVLSADHGNAMGEWGEWAHPPGALGPAVRKVPWAQVAGVDLETVTPTITVSGEDGGIETPNKQLQALGYQ